MKSTKTIILSTTFGFLSFLTVLDAATYATCDGKKQIWKSHSTAMFLDTSTIPIGSQWDLHTQYMMSEWNSVAGSDFMFYVGRDTDGSVSSTNRKNEIARLNKPHESYIARTLYNPSSTTKLQ